MNIRLFIKSKLPMLVTALFFIGIVISACFLYILAMDLPESKLAQTYSLIGFTFLTGIASVNLIAWSKKQTVVYLERKEIDSDEKTEIRSTGCTIALSAINKIIESGNHVLQNTLNELCKQLGAGQGAIYVSNERTLELQYGYALSTQHKASAYAVGDGLVGRVASEGQSLYIDKLPEGYVNIFSGLGSASPSHLIMVPIKMEDEVKGVIEIATFAPVNEETRYQLEKIGESLATSI